jgi:hypothetical protein
MAGLEMTALDGVQHPYRPQFQQQGPDSNCRILANGVMHNLGWDSCTAYSMAMMIDRLTAGRRRPSGCAVRRDTNPLDTSGGLTLNQVAAVARNDYGLAISVYVGSGVVSPQYLARQIRAGRPAVVQGNAAAMLGTRFRSTDGDVNHAVYVNEVRGGTLDEPSEALVYDPAADARRAGIDQGPSWWPWSMVKKFASYLRPAGEGMPRLGPGKVYCAIGPDTEPHVSLITGAKQAHPFPDRVRAASAPTVIHRHPSSGNILRSVPKGTLLRLYQYSGGWGGNDDGTEWVFLANTSHVGGAT